MKRDSLNVSGWVNGLKPPTWVKLVRSGNTFMGYYSTDGLTWTLLHSVDVPMSTNVTAGLAVCAHSNGSLNITKFDNVMMTPSFPLEDTDVGVVGIAGSVNLSNGVYTASGSGKEIYGNDDQFNYDYQSVNGDVTLIARVVLEDSTRAYAQSGVMIRETLATDSANVNVVMSPTIGVCMDVRMHHK
jgi:regulation of enolase protein 1 (concanavalin A-like superfamily)